MAPTANPTDSVYVTVIGEKSNKPQVGFDGKSTITLKHNEHYTINLINTTTDQYLAAIAINNDNIGNFLIDSRSAFPITHPSQDMRKFKCMALDSPEYAALLDGRPVSENNDITFEIYKVVPAPSKKSLEVQVDSLQTDSVDGSKATTVLSAEESRQKYRTQTIHDKTFVKKIILAIDAEPMEKYPNIMAEKN
ncbi:hypothetical protein CcNV_069 [Crangon crangon nudivirus]|uniref:Uncharacterized protein n=1 Tax=Crangon crangon nudivirus TaxID=2880838 RepID=A0AAE8Y250_9VIRU|nr:hypothetical protein QKT25_gp070 [Crangon crangon nudivirus]UBZ25554.1 hypothetical protein CcNV_069 [Crangon crangon nudivirus]